MIIKGRYLDGGILDPIEIDDSNIEYVGVTSYTGGDRYINFLMKDNVNLKTLILLIAFLGLLAYANSFFGEFLWDDYPLIINNYLAKYQSPMTGMGEFIVAKAEELGNRLPVDPTYLAFLTIAVGQNESNLGKKMPPNCFNAWGYGIHSSGTLCFKNWEEGITKFMTGVAENYITKRGLDTPEEMMTMYTPHSPNGAWAKGVKQFMEDLKEAGQ